MAIVLLVLSVVLDVFNAVQQGPVGWFLLGKAATAGAIVWFLRQALRDWVPNDKAGHGPPRT